VPIVYHQPEGGFPAEVDFVDLEVMEASIPHRFVYGGDDIITSAMNAAKEIWPQLENSGKRFLDQQKWVHAKVEKVIAAEAAKIGKTATLHARSETPSMSENSLPKQYRDFNFQKRLVCPKQQEQDGDPENTRSEDGCVVSLHHSDHDWYHRWEQQFFDFQTPYSENHQLAVLTAWILQHRFDTKYPPPADLIYNMKYFGGAYAQDDPRKVFEFYEWNAWFANDLRPCGCRQEEGHWLTTSINEYSLKTFQGLSF
jgi:hypothetical protein